MVFQTRSKLSAIPNADLIVVLDEGRAVEQENHWELMAARGLYYELISQQALKHLKEFAPLAFGHPELEGIIPEAERAIQKLQSSLNN